MASKENDWFQRSMSNGLIATIAWVLLLIVYTTFQTLKIEAPGINQAFLVLTGVWGGILTLAQSNKNKEVKEELDELKKVVHRQENSGGPDG